MQKAATGRYNPSKTVGKMPATGNGLSLFLKLHTGPGKDLLRPGA